MSVMSRGFLASQATAALQVMVLPLVAARLSMKAEDMARTKFLVAELSIYKGFLATLRQKFLTQDWRLATDQLRCCYHMKRHN